MRISDWSSDVCSSDLPAGTARPQQLLLLPGGQTGRHGRKRRRPDAVLWPVAIRSGADEQAASGSQETLIAVFPSTGQIGRASCRERVLSVRVDLGGRRSIKKKNIDDR